MSHGRDGERTREQRLLITRSGASGSGNYAGIIYSSYFRRTFHDDTPERNGTRAFFLVNLLAPIKRLIHYFRSVASPSDFSSSYFITQIRYLYRASHRDTSSVPHTGLRIHEREVARLIG